ncbi:MATE family efflux transporter [Schleiferia thermophila]|nr:MATE family efflux transporter [Schleiferia thermophila]KFD40022.1 multidrug transporter [Schleiferia thermophila str. Yellowstone]
MKSAAVRDHYRENFRLAWPVMIGQLGQITVSVADNVMVGQLGTEPLAAASLVNGLFTVVLVFGIGVAYGLTPLVANARGAGKKHLLPGLLNASLWVNLFTGAALFLILLMLNPALNHMRQNPQVVELAAPYLSITGLSVIPILGFFAFKQFAEGLGHTRQAMQITIAVNVLNIVLNYLLIFGKFGFPALGLNGAGYATLISRLVMWAAMAAFVLHSRLFKGIDFTFSLPGVQRRTSYEILSIGVPSGFQYIFEVSAFAAASVLAGMISPASQAAHQIAINLASISYMAATGLAAASTIRVGHLLGMRDSFNLHLAVRTILVMTVTWMTFAGLVFLFGRHFFPTLYSSDPEVLQIARSLLIVAVFFQISDGVQAVGLGVMRGLKDVKIPTLITFVSYWIFAMPGSWIFGVRLGGGVVVIWYFLAIGLTVSAALLLWRYRVVITRLHTVHNENQTL